MKRSDLERARTLSPIPDLTLEGLARRRKRKEAHRRTSTTDRRRGDRFPRHRCSLRSPRRNRVTGT